MSEAPTGSGGPDPETPVLELLDQQMEAGPDFVGRVRRRIQRRTTASQFASFSWNLPRAALLEMARLLGHICTAHHRRKDPQP